MNLTEMIMGKLTRDFFETHGWERDDFEFEGKMIWQVRLSRSFEGGDKFFSDAYVTNMMYDDRFAMHGDITGNCKISHLMLYSVEQYEHLLALLCINSQELIMGKKNKTPEKPDWKALRHKLPKSE